MSKLRIGIIVNQKSDPKQGGGHSYYDMLLQGINEYEFNPDIEIYNIVFYSKKIPHLNLKKPCLYINHGGESELKETVKKTSLSFLNLNLNRKNPLINSVVSYLSAVRDRKAEQTLRKNKIDLIYYLKHEWEVLNYPFIATHWDNCHKSMAPFPEVALDGNYEKREKYHLFTLNKAFIIFCESVAGAKELKKFNDFNDDKIRVLPIFAGNVINRVVPDTLQQQILNRFNLEKEKFFLYPAQFWAHKNHYNLINAFVRLINKNNDKELKLVLCGSDHGNMQYIKDYVKSLSLNDRIMITGFVSLDELGTFYRNAIALTMTTFLGPTNMPLIEAAYLNCPVLCSNLEGHKEILGDNALYVEPANVDSIEKAMEQMLDKSTRERLIKSASEHIRQSPFTLNNSLKILNEVFTEILPYRKAWGQ